MLVNMAINKTKDENSTPKMNNPNRPDTNSTCNSIEKLRKRHARSMSANATQFTPNVSVSDIQNPSTSQFQRCYGPQKKRARSLSTNVNLPSDIECLDSSHQDILLTSISSKELSIHTADINHTHHQLSNIDMNKSGLNNSFYLEKKLKISVPIHYTKNRDIILRRLETSAVQFTSSLGPIHSWIHQIKNFNSRIAVYDIVINNKPTYESQPETKIGNVENDNNSIEILQQYHLLDSNVCSSSSPSMITQTNIAESIEKSCKTLSRQERPRRQVRTRGGKSCSPRITKEEMNENIAEECIGMIGTVDENDSNVIDQTNATQTNVTENVEKSCETLPRQEIPRRRVRTRGGKSCSPCIPKEKINDNIEEELTAMIGTVDEKESNVFENHAADNAARGQHCPLSDEQLLQILRDPDENYDEYVFEDAFIESFNDDDYHNSDTSDESEEELVPSNTEEETEWSNQRRPSRIIEFEGNTTGLKIQPDGSEPIDYFNLVVTDECFHMNVDKSNENASKLLAQSAPRGRIRHWKKISIPEFKIFLGLLFHMGTIKINRIPDHWKKHRLYNLSCFSDYMSRNRFLLILRVLHFNDNDNVQDNRLAKISPLVSYFKNRMKEIYYPSNSLCIDESLVLWRGRLLFRQYIKNKHNKYGIKLYIMTDVNGIILKIIVYAGAGDTVVGGTNHAAKVITNLLHDYVGKGHSVFMDNFYNSVELTENLLAQNTFCTGTLRPNRKNNPKDVTTKKLKKGEYIAQYNKNGVCVIKWRDNRDVLLISSKYDAQMTPITTRRNTEVIKPDMVINYNKNMGGIDHQDQMMSYYSCEHKTVRWYKKLGIHLLQQMLYNSFTLYNLQAPNKKSFYDFRLAVIECLLPENQVSHVTSKVDCKVHVIQPCPKAGKTMRRRCKVCWETGKKRKDTPFYCPDCPGQPGLCILNCFKQFHNY